MRVILVGNRTAQLQNWSTFPFFGRPNVQIKEQIRDNTSDQVILAVNDMTFTEKARSQPSHRVRPPTLLCCCWSLQLSLSLSPATKIYQPTSLSRTAGHSFSYFGSRRKSRATRCGFRGDIRRHRSHSNEGSNMKCNVKMTMSTTGNIANTNRCNDYKNILERTDRGVVLGFKHLAKNEPMNLVLDSSGRKFDPSLLPQRLQKSRQLFQKPEGS